MAETRRNVGGNAAPLGGTQRAKLAGMQPTFTPGRSDQADKPQDLAGGRAGAHADLALNRLMVRLGLPELTTDQHPPSEQFLEDLWHSRLSPSRLIASTSPATTPVVEPGSLRVEVEATRDDRDEWKSQVQLDVSTAVNLAFASQTFRHFLGLTHEGVDTDRLARTVTSDLVSLVVSPSQVIREVNAFVSDPPVRLVAGFDGSSALLVGGTILADIPDFRRRRHGRTAGSDAVVDVGLEILLLIAGICKLKVSQQTRQALVLEAKKKFKNDPRWRKFFIGLVRLRFRTDVREFLKKIYRLLAAEAVAVEIFQTLFRRIEFWDVLMAIGRCLGYLALRWIPGLSFGLYLAGLGLGLAAVAEKIDRYTWPAGETDADWEEELSGSDAGDGSGDPRVAGPEPYRPFSGAVPGHEPEALLDPPEGEQTPPEPPAEGDTEVELIDM